MGLKVNGENEVNKILNKFENPQNLRSTGYLEAEENNATGASQQAVDQISLILQNQILTTKTENSELSINYKKLTKQSFEILDLDKNGEITLEDWKKLNLDQEIFEIISQGKGKIDRSIWDNFIRQLEIAELSISKKPSNWSQFDFYVLDFKKDGIISRKEWEMAGGNLKFFEILPKNNQGDLTIRQWNEFMRELDAQYSRN